MTVDVATGEILPMGPGVLTPAQAAERAQWVRDILRSALTEGTDYGVIPGTDKPDLLKPGAEMLLLAAGLGFTMTKLEDADAREHRGVTYKCTVRRGGVVVSECEGFAGYDESRFFRPADGKKDEYRAPWNTVLKMAQKRALVGAVKNATAASGLFAEEGEDDGGRARKGRRGSGTRSGSRHSEPTRTPAQPGIEGTTALETRRDQLPNDYRVAFSRWLRAQGLTWPPTTPEDLARMTEEIAKCEHDAGDEGEAYGDGAPTTEEPEPPRRDYEPPVGSPID